MVYSIVQSCRSGNLSRRLHDLRHKAHTLKYVLNSDGVYSFALFQALGVSRRHARGLVDLYNEHTNCGDSILFFVPIVLFHLVASGYTFFEAKFRTWGAKGKTPGNGSFVLDLLVFWHDE